MLGQGGETKLPCTETGLPGSEVWCAHKYSKEPLYEPKKCYNVMLIKYYGSSESGESLKDSFNGGDILVGL